MLLERCRIEGLVGTKIRSGPSREAKNLLPQLGAEPRFFDLSNRRLFTMLNDLTWLVLVYLHDTSYAYVRGHVSENM